MRCERCGFNILKGDNFCSDCGAPNTRYEHANLKLRGALLGALESIGITDARSVSFMEAFERRMWPEDMKPTQHGWRP